MKNSQALRGYLMILASALCFGSYGVWSRLLGPEFAIFFQGWVRSALILLILIPIALIKRDFKPITGKGKSWFWVTMLFTVFTQVPIYYAFNHLALGTATLIFYSLFLITSYIIGWLFLGEKMSGVKIISMLVALIGLFFTFGFSLKLFSLAALLLAALNGVASGGEVATSKKSTQAFSTLQVTTYSWIFILLTHLPISLALGEHQVMPALNKEWLAMLGYAASGLLGFALVIEGFKHVDASIGGLIGLMEIIFSIAFGILFFGNSLNVSIILGGACIIVAAVLPDLYARFRSHKGDPPPIPELL